MCAKGSINYTITVSANLAYGRQGVLESAAFNIGKNKLYEGVAGNLVAYSCKVSFQKGYEGFVAFTAKTRFDKALRRNTWAYHFKNQRMIINSEPEKLLVDKYFKT